VTRETQHTHTHTHTHTAHETAPTSRDDFTFDAGAIEAGLRVGEVKLELGQLGGEAVDYLAKLSHAQFHAALLSVQLAFRLVVHLQSVDQAYEREAVLVQNRSLTAKKRFEFEPMR
jgi:hypothetical protein